MATTTMAHNNIILVLVLLYSHCQVVFVNSLAKITIFVQNGKKI